MVWVKDELGDSYYMEAISDECVIKIERWEHGYYVIISNNDSDDEASVVLKYFYSFQDARMFLTRLSRVLRSTDCEGGD